MKKTFFAALLSLIVYSGAVAQDSRLKILEQPLPELPRNSSTLTVQGSVVLRVQFLDSGEIGEIVEVRGLPHRLTELATEAAKKIRFEPEKKEGKPVTITRSVEYSFSWNGGWSLPRRLSGADSTGDAEKAEAVIAKAVKALGGEKYLTVTSQVGRGKFSEMKNGAVVSFRSFVDIIVFPDKERTEFKGEGTRYTQVNVGDTGWVFDGSMEVVKDQTELQLKSFRQGMRVSLDNLLRGAWRNKATLSYVGRRAGALARRHDVIKLVYPDEQVVEVEFSVDDGLPVRAVYARLTADGDEIIEEDRYAQFIETSGIRSPFVIDHVVDGKTTSRINFESIEYNRPIPSAVFAKPANAKEAKKEIKY